MTLVKFKRRPLSSLMAPSFFDTEDFFGGSLLSPRLLMEEPFFNGRNIEPAMNIKENDDNFEIELAAPGFGKKDFKVSIDNGCLNITAEKSTSKKEEEENYTRKEFSYNSFERSLQLPDIVKEEDIKAKYNDGILSFKLAKKEEAKKTKPKMIEIS